MALPDDELELVSKELTFGPDYTRFRSVCKSWRSIARKRPQLPWSIAHNDRGHSDREIDFYQFSFETNKFTQIPELSRWPSSFSDDYLIQCIGSSHGWMAIFDHQNSSLSLSNPLTNSTINLRNPPNWCSNSSRFSFILTSDPGESLLDCFALIYCSERILYCKIGCSGWMEIEHPVFDCFASIHFCCHRGKVFIASGSDVFVCDFGWLGWNPSVCKIASVASKSNNFTGIRKAMFTVQGSYLVESDGDLLLVHRYDTKGFEDCDEEYYFEVFKLEFGWKQVKLVELTGLGDRALFLFENTSISLTASKYTGCKENSIYLTLFASDCGSFIQTIIMFDFENMTSVLVYDVHAIWTRCDLFAPNLLT